MEILFETLRLGRAVKITAYDPATGTEVSLQADASTPMPHLQKLATQKLLKKLQGE